MKRLRRMGLGLLSLMLATAIWLPCVHFLFRDRVANYFGTDAIAPKARAIAQHHMRLWTDPKLREQEVQKMRGSNAEWDFMGRTFLVLSLANIGCRDADSKDASLAIMDKIIEETLLLEKEKGIYFFLMDYARDGHFISKPSRSLFIDGEIALMIGARQMLEEKQEFKTLLKERVDVMISTMRQSPVLSGESYPDECWTFCNSVALAAIRISDVLDGRDHSDFLKQWVVIAKTKLTHLETGLLVSSYNFDGRTMDGTEGSSIWMAVHCLQLVDEEFARDQYLRAKKELARTLLGFGYAREWPTSWHGPQDIDSGPIIPVLEISAGSSGLAFLGASSFEDREYLSSLLASLNLGGFPIEKNGRLKYCASNQVGDAVMLYAMVQGPLWQRVKVRAKS